MGLFYEKCLVVEIYQNTCFCDNFLTGELVQVVGYHSNTVYGNHYGGLCQKSQHSAVQDQVPCADVYVMYGVQYFHLGPPSLPASSSHTAREPWSDVCIPTDGRGDHHLLGHPHVWFCVLVPLDDPCQASVHSHRAQVVRRKERWGGWERELGRGGRGGEEKVRVQEGEVGRAGRRGHHCQNQHMVCVTITSLQQFLICTL